MRILLLGATGRTGKLVLDKLIEKGYQVNCIARKSERIQSRDQLVIFEGNPNNETDLNNAIADCDAVISVLNISRKSDFPWASLRTPKTYLSDVMSLLVPMAENRDIKRISICSAWGVLETKNDIPKWFKWLINNSNIGYAYKDHERQENIVAKSKLNWTIVRPVGLSNSKKKEKIRTTFNKDPKPNILISRQSVADYLVESLENGALIKRKVVISKD